MWLLNLLCHGNNIKSYGSCFGYFEKFSGDGSRSALDHLQLIEDRCMLFKLAKISKDEVKRKLLYLSLDADAQVWFRSINEEYHLDCEHMKKAFNLNYYPPIELIVIEVIFITFGLIQEKVLLKLGEAKKVPPQVTRV
jgi:hypothetical protein